MRGSRNAELGMQNTVEKVKSIKSIVLVLFIFRGRVNKT